MKQRGRGNLLDHPYIQIFHHKIIFFIFISLILSWYFSLAGLPLWPPAVPSCCLGKHTKIEPAAILTVFMHYSRPNRGAELRMFAWCIHMNTCSHWHDCIMTTVFSTVCQASLSLPGALIRSSGKPNVQRTSSWPTLTCIGDLNFWQRLMFNLWVMRMFLFWI